MKRCMLVEKMRAVCIKKSQRTFPDGGVGYFCEFLGENGDMVAAWLSKEVDAKTPVAEQDVEDYDPKKSKLFRFSVTLWEGKKKRKVVDVQ